MRKGETFPVYEQKNESMIQDWIRKRLLKNYVWNTAFYDLMPRLFNVGLQIIWKPMKCMPVREYRISDIIMTEMML